MEGSGATLSMDQITGAITNIFQVCGQVLKEIVANPFFLMVFVIGLVYAAINLIRALKH